MLKTKSKIISIMAFLSLLIVFAIYPLTTNKQISVEAEENEELINSVSVKSNAYKYGHGSSTEYYYTNDKAFLIYSHPNYGDYNDYDFHNFDSYGLVSGTKAITPTDWNLVNGAYIPTARSSNYDYEKSTMMQVTRTSQQQQPPEPYVKYVSILWDELEMWMSSSARLSARVAMQFNSPNVVNLLKDGKATLSTLEVGTNKKLFHALTLDEYMFPQTIVSDENIINSLNALTEDSKTGRIYAGLGTYDAKTGLFDPDQGYPEYAFDGNYYVKAVQNTISGTPKYSDGTDIKEAGDVVWIKVEPIVWCIAPESYEEFADALTNLDIAKTGGIDVFSYKALITGITVYPTASDAYATTWASSFLRAYLNGYDLSENQGDGGDDFKSPAKANFKGYGFVDMIYHTQTLEAIEIPTINEDTFSYSGQSFDILNYISNLDTDNVIVVTNKDNIEPGKYEIVFKLKDIFRTCWIDGTKKDITFYYNILKVQLAKPYLTQVAFKFNNEDIYLSGFIKNYDENKMNVKGDLVVHYIGEYEITFSLMDTIHYEWTDSSNRDLSLSFLVVQNIPVVPSVEIPELLYDEFFYDGTEMDVSKFLENFDETVMDISGDTVIDGVGEYKIVISLKDSTKAWADGTVEPIEIIFKVEPKQNTQSIIIAILILLALIAIPIPIVLAAISKKSKKKKDFL